MSAAVVVLLGLSFSGVPAQDTVVVLERGDRLLIEDLSGTVSVATWDRNEVKAVTDRRGVDLEFVRSDGRVSLEVRDRRERETGGLYQLMVPSWVALEISGGELDVEVEDVSGGVLVHTVDGDVSVRGAAGPVNVRSMDGEVRVEDVDGDVDAHSTDDDAIVRRVRGSVAGESVSGDVMLLDVVGPRVTGRSTEGDVRFVGSIVPGGSYELSTHDGNLTVEIPASSSADVVVRTYDGDFESSFPVRTERIESGGEYRFTLGDGGARMTLEAFDGEIRLLQRSR